VSGYVYIWEYRVSPENIEAFRAAYGPDGPWVRLFTGQPGHLRTELLQDRDDPGRFVTIDHWASRDDFETFDRARRAEFASLDGECERLTESERRLGEFRGEVVEAP
jgi:heme-degrading monooxygenase HmoA